MEISPGEHTGSDSRGCYKKKDHQEVLTVCQSIEVVVIEIFARNGRRSNAKLQDT